MSYASLADEIVLYIVNLIRPRDLENFALVNRRTYRIANQKLERRRALKRNARVMTTRFGTSYHSIWIGLCVIAPGHILKQRPDVAEKYGCPPDGSAAELDYLELNGDLYWLRPHDAEISATHDWYRGRAASKEQLNELAASAQRVGIEFPPGFLDFMGSDELIQRMYLGGDYCYLGDSLVKCNPEDDDAGGGYAIRFLCDQQSCDFWALYMAPGGYHCVVQMQDDVHCWICARNEREGGEPDENHPKPQLFEDIPIACGPVRLSMDHPNFEEWLVMKYFDGWCYATLKKKDRELTKSQTEYLDNFWPRK
jgi:hypothetical protein